MKKSSKQINFRGLKHAPLDAPRFKSRREEAKWWDSHQDAIADDLERAAAKGELMLACGGEVIGPAITRPTTLRLLVDDIAEARKQAAAKGLRYQTYLKMLIHEALRSNAI